MFTWFSWLHLIGQVSHVQYNSLCIHTTLHYAHHDIAADVEKLLEKLWDRRSPNTVLIKIPSLMGNAFVIEVD